VVSESHQICVSIYLRVCRFPCVFSLICGVNQVFRTGFVAIGMTLNSWMSVCAHIYLYIFVCMHRYVDI